MKPRSELTPAEVSDLIARLARRLEGEMVPTLPHVASEVVKLVGDPDSSLRDFAAVLKTDQALTGKLLRMSNSVAFAQRNPATTIERAMVVLGLSRLKALVLGFQLVSSCGNGDDSKRAWSEAVLRGWIAHAVAAEFNPRLAGEAFIIGLMLDAGLPMMERLLGEKYAQLVPAELPPGKAFAIENTQLPFTHADITAAMMTIWNFPSLLAVPMSHHHESLPAPNLEDPEQLLRAVAYYAGSLDLGASISGAPDAGRFLPGVAQRLFSLSRDRLAELIQAACGDYAESRELFGSAIDEQFDTEAILQQANSTLVDQLGDLIARLQVDGDGKGTRTFEADGRCLAFSLVGPGTIRVVVSDREGTPLFVEELMPGSVEAGEMRSMLLLDEATDEEFELLMSEFTSLAA